MARTITVPAVPRFIASWRPDPVAWVIGIVGAALFVSYSIAQWRAYAVPSWDLGIFTQLAQQYAHLHTPIVDIKGPGFNLLGDHFHPILVLLGPVFRLFPSGLSLLVLQGILFGWSAVPITRYARLRLGGAWGTVLGVAYVVSWGLTEAVKSQFHEIAFAVPLLAYGIVFFLEGKMRAALITIGMLVFIKEDLGLTVAACGFLMIWIEWGKVARAEADAQGTRPLPLRGWDSLRKALGNRETSPAIGLIRWGLFWFLAAILIILPLLNPDGNWDYTGRLAETEGTGSGLAGFFVGLFGPGEKIVTLFLLIIAMGIVGLISPLWWLMVPTLAWRFAGNVEFYWGWGWHYSAILMPIAALALVDGVERLRGKPELRESWRRGVAGGAVMIALAGTVGMAWNGPLGQLARGRVATSDERAAGAAGAIEAAGTGKRIVSDLSLLAYLVPGNTVFWEGTVAEAPVDTVVIGPSHDAHGPGIDPAQWAGDRYGGSWQVAYDEAGYTVLTKLR